MFPGVENTREMCADCYEKIRASKEQRRRKQSAAATPSAGLRRTTRKTQCAWNRNLSAPRAACAPPRNWCAPAAAAGVHRGAAIPALPIAPRAGLPASNRRRLQRNEV